MGAWIEISADLAQLEKDGVAPLVGAWIEMTDIAPCLTDWKRVAPLVGAWIEISHTSTTGQTLSSLPSWERGLKFRLQNILQVHTFVAPLVGAWIEIIDFIQ